MSKYIDADKIIQIISERMDDIASTYGENDEYVQAMDECITKIENAPTADVKPIVRGKWNEIGELNGLAIYHCSLCGHIVVKKKDRCLIKPPFYCANCGAEMEGEQE